MSEYYSTRQKDDVTIVDLLADHFNLESSNPVMNACNSLITDEGASKLVINFQKVSYMTTSGIGALLSIYRTSINHGAQMVLCNLNDDIKDVLHVTMVDGVISIVNTQEEAFKSFSVL